MTATAPGVTKVGLLDLQVCVPSDYTDEEIIAFAESCNPCGTTNGWQIRRQGDRLLAGDDERVVCSDYTGFVHVMLDA